jgi:hypothetical protein
MAFRNREGYHDPTAGDAAAKVQKQEKSLRAIREIESYEHLCLAFREQAARQGFKFPADIWLVNIKSGKYHKGN